MPRASGRDGGAGEGAWSQTRRDVLDQEFHELLGREWIDPPANSDFVRGMMAIPSDGFTPTGHPRAIAESPSIYFNAMLSITEDATARFLPAADSDYALLLHKVKTTQKFKRQLRDSLLVNTMQHVLVPALDEEKMQVVAAIRENEVAFAEWRNGLRAVIAGHSLPSTEDIEEVQDSINCQLQHLLGLIRREITASHSLRSRISRAKLEWIDVEMAAVVEPSR